MFCLTKKTEEPQHKINERVICKQWNCPFKCRWNISISHINKDSNPISSSSVSHSRWRLAQFVVCPSKCESPVVALFAFSDFIAVWSVFDILAFYWVKLNESFLKKNKKRDVEPHQMTIHHTMVWKQRERSGPKISRLPATITMLLLIGEAHKKYLHNTIYGGIRYAESRKHEALLAAVWNANFRARNAAKQTAQLHTSSD